MNLNKQKLEKKKHCFQTIQQVNQVNYDKDSQDGFCFKKDKRVKAYMVYHPPKTCQKLAKNLRKHLSTWAILLIGLLPVGSAKCSRTNLSVMITDMGS